MKAVIYARYSSNNQREESIEGQIRECRNYAEKKGYEIISAYADRAISGTTDSRPEFQKLIKDSDKKIFDVVIVYKVDRFARNRYDSAMYKSRLKKNGVILEYAKESIPDSPEGIILESMLEGMAEYYSANLGENTKRGKYENATKGKLNGGVTPFGYTRTDGNYFPDKKNAAIVKLIFDLYIDGVPYAQITKRIADGYGTRFSISGIKNLLANKTYTGTYRYKTNDGEEFIFENHHAAIVSAETFEKAEKKRQQNKKSPNANKGAKKYMLSGAVKCGICGAPVIICHSYRHGIPMYYRLNCLGRKERKNCTNPTVKMPPVENAVIRALQKNILDKKMIDTLSEKACAAQEKETDTNSAQFSAELTAVRKSKNNLMIAIEQGIITPTTKQRLQELEASESDLQIKIAQAETKNSKLLTKQQIKKFLESYCSGDMTDENFRIELVRTFIKEIKLFPEKLEIIFTFAESEFKKVVEIEY